MPARPEYGWPIGLGPAWQGLFLSAGLGFLISVCGDTAQAEGRSGPVAKEHFQGAFWNLSRSAQQMLIRLGIVQPRCGAYRAWQHSYKGPDCVFI